MTPEQDRMSGLLESVADGRPLDWAVLRAQAKGEKERRTLRQLHLIAEVERFHRSEPPLEPEGVFLPDADTREAPTTTSLRDDALASSAQAPKQWGHFELIERVGLGSYGDVFRARDTQLGRDVAVKLFRGAPRDRLVERMLSEAQMLARVHHPNVVTVYGAEDRDGRAGIWMELVRGTTLRDLVLNHGPFSAAEAALIGQELCRALAAVHAAGLVHRDVKANNVMREEGGRVVLMDFSAGHLQRDLERAKHAVGTPLYLAPEVLEGQDADARSDIYSLGILLYHLVTGSYPVHAETIEDLRTAHHRGERTRLQDARPDLPDAFVRVVERAAHAQPIQRYASAGALLVALGQALGFADDSAPGAGVPLDRWDRATGPVPFLPSVASPHRKTLARVAALVALAVFPAVGIYYAYKQAGDRSSFRAGAPRPLAVVPFENSTGDPAWSQLVSGLTDDVTRELQKSGVVVKGRASASTLAGLSLPDLSGRLKVDALVRGSVSRAGQNVVLVVYLIRAGTGERLWGPKSYTQPPDQLGALYTSVAREIAQATGGSGDGPGPDPQARPVVFRAYEAYHKGRAHAEQRDKEALHTAIQYFKEAARWDPGWAQPWAGMADAYLALGIPTFGALPPQEARRLATEAALRALELDPNVAEAHNSLAFLAYVYDWNWKAAEERFQRAIALNPQYAGARHWYADYLAAMGRHEEAGAEISRARELEPLSVLIQRDLAWHSFCRRNYDQAKRQLEETLATNPRYTPARTLLGRVLIEQGKTAEGLSELERVAPDLPRSSALGFLAYAHAAAGKPERAESLLRELVSLPGPEYVSPYYIALVHTRLGRAAQALRWLERGFVEQDTTMVSLRVDPRFDSLRRTARFQALLKRMNFPESDTSRQRKEG